MKKNFLLSILFVSITIISFAQNDRFWSANTQLASKIPTDKAVSRLAYPKEFKLINLNLTALKQELFTAAGANAASKHSTVVSLPNANGTLEQFEVFEASNFDVTLQTQFPNIRAFSGKGITDKSATLKLSISPQGIQTMVFRTEKENEFMEPYSQDHTVYAVYNSQRTKDNLGWRCSTQEQEMVTGINNQVTNANIFARSGGDLKTMRLAQSCNAEYANYFGATSSAQVGLVLAAFNATLTRCNGVYEKDLALHLNLVAASTSVIYYNAATDPYSTTLSQWNAQLQSTLTANIGEANYDIGHMFGATGGGGNAGCIGCVCVNGSKGSGITSPNDGIPQGDNFDIDYVVHEVGHQLGGNHTFSMTLEGSGVNKEVGSGITIMGYAGITAQDVAPHSIDIYHQATIAQIQANLATKTCPVTSTITNATPVVNAVSNVTIPISTPFALTGSATDANASDVLTYCWEQNDNSTVSGTSSVASATKASGPNWVSFSPTTSPTRMFPKLATILAGLNVSGPLPGGDAGANSEALSSVSRALNFRLTVRDNAPYISTAPVCVGQTQFTDVVVTVSNTSGPFAVTAPNTAITWNVGTTQNVTWSVNNTTAAPVSCANVSIALSTDGGNTFTTLVASTPNSGTASVTVPNSPSTTCRIKVSAVGNIFFDISNANFTIGGTAPTCNAAAGLSASAISNNAATISWTNDASAISYDVDYKLNAATVWTNAAAATTASTLNLAGLTQGSLYDYRVRINCAAGAGNYTASQFTTTAPCGTPTGLATTNITANTATVSYAVVSGANNYNVDYKLSTATGWTAAATGTTATSVNIASLSASSTYDWRVSANCTSGTSPFATAQFTTTTVSTCPGPLDVSTNGTITGAATIPFNTDVKGTIGTSTDVDWYKFVVTVGGTATITLGTLPADFDVAVFKSNGTTQLAISQNGSTTSETISRTYTSGTYYIKVFGYSGAFNATNCYTLKLALGTASRISPDAITVKDNFAIYPNPVNEMLKVTSGLNETVTINIVDMYGKKVASKTATSAATFDMSSLSSGVYLVTIFNKNGKIIKQEKVVKQ